MIKFDKVTKKYPTGDTVLSDVDLEISPQEMVVISGPSGSGKTTLLRMIIKDLEPTSGTIFLDGEDLSKVKSKHIPTIRRKVGFVFQDYKIIPEKNVYENIALVLEIIGLSKEAIKERVEHLIELVGMKGKELLFPRQLSGGELQRVSIARAIAHEPKVLLADEPTGNLDSETAWGIVNLLEQINRMGTTIVMTSHNLGIIENLKARHVELKEGKIVSDSGQMKREKRESEQTEDISFESVDVLDLVPGESQVVKKKKKKVKNKKD